MSPTAGPTPLRRDTRRGVVAGVLAGLGARAGIDPVVLRVAFVIAAIASGGLALLAYLVPWAALPAEDGRGAPLASLVGVPRVRGDWRLAAGVGLLTLSILLAFRELGIWWSDALVWPLVLAAFGAALLWGRSRSGAARRDRAAPPAWAASDVSAAREVVEGHDAAAAAAPSRV